MGHVRARSFCFLWRYLASHLNFILDTLQAAGFCSELVDFSVLRNDRMLPMLPSRPLILLRRIKVMKPTDTRLTNNSFRRLFASTALRKRWAEGAHGPVSPLASFLL